MKSRFMLVMTLGVLFGPTSLAAGTGQLKHTKVPADSIVCSHARQEKLVADAADAGTDKVLPGIRKAHSAN